MARIGVAPRADGAADASPGTSPDGPSASASLDPANLAWVEVERRTSSILAVVAVLSAVVSIAIGLVLAEALIRPLRDLGKAASAIAGGDLARRSGVGDRRDEIGDLGRSFDTMAAALEQADTSR
ncbi:MAG: HAMP domain-containing protein, partial [Candidatus Limnocylindrales bacterium]